jgi:hypothetical protein
VITRVANDSSEPTPAEVFALLGRYAVAGDICTVSYNNQNNAVVYRYITAWSLFVTYITGSLIVDNTITGDKVAANTITGTNIAGTTITGSNIAGSTITANKLSVTQLSAISADLGTITAGTIRLPATGTSYIIIDGANNRIDVYDSGVLRVRLGQL